MDIYIMQGIPGSGKSRWVYNEMDRIDPDQISTIYLSTDQLHMVGNEYRFDQTKLQEYHDQILRCYTEYVTTRPIYITTLFVDNTNISIAELSPFYRLAQAYGHKVEIIRIECDPKTAYMRNTHGVPPTTIYKMWRTMQREELPPWWKVRVVIGV